MAITPVDMSSLANQRSDLSKVALDDFLRFQQQQFAHLIQKEQAEHAISTKMVEGADDVMINTDHTPPRQPNRDEEEKKEPSADKADVEEPENVEYVVYNDPELGNALDWRG